MKKSGTEPASVEAAAVEPIIDHLKIDYRLLKNYLKGVEDDMMNTIMAAASFNMMKKLRQIPDTFYFVLDCLTQYWLVKYTTPTSYFFKKTS